MFLLSRRVEKDACITLKGRSGQNLNSGEGQVMTQVGHVGYQSICRDETNTATPLPTFLVLFNRELLARKTIGNLR